MSWLFWYCIISHCFFTLILYKLTENLNNPTVKRPRKTRNEFPDRNNYSQDQNRSIDYDRPVQESSIWCYGRQRSERICVFRNLCYSPMLKEYLFFHGDSSIIQGVPENRCSPALLDLASIKDHNLQYFNFQDAPVSALEHFSDIAVFNQSSLLFHRFNPENIMHVIHDDLLPLFYTLRHYFPNFEKPKEPFNMDVQIFLMEGRQEGTYFDLYKIFSSIKPILLADIFSPINNSLICYQEVTVGISKTMTWYDYGFNNPQGPIPNHTADGAVIRQFTEYVTSKLKINKTNNEKSGYVILFSRESNRLILNELELTFLIATTLNLRVIRLSLENNKLDEIIQQIQGSSGIIGMHGSVLVLSMFLSPGSFLVELFPYAINPEHYTPYKTLAQIPGMDLTYRAWQNKMKKNTITYPNRSKLEGGITHLDAEMQSNILNTSEVPQHLCCDNPYWLFRIYQDTIVDTSSFTEVLKSVLNGTKKTHKKDQIKSYPGKIKTVFCEVENRADEAAIFVSWKPSWNMQFFNSTQVTYEVWFQDILNDTYMAYALQDVTRHTFNENLKYNTSYNIWVRGVISGNTGPFSDVCTCST